jgi:D-glycero-D-manno-heptose 1,7-bisphosphate phosphatase
VETVIDLLISEPCAMEAFDAVFLDRDGTINVKPPEESYVCSPSQLRLLPGAGEAIRALNDAGLLVLVVTNQRGVASQKMSLSDVHEVHRALAADLGRFGARVDGFYICPHADGTCGCRKPEPGLLLQASRDHPGLRLERTVLIGDSETDVKAAAAVGASAVRLAPKGTESAASCLFADLASAVSALLAPAHRAPDACGPGPPHPKDGFRKD